MPVYKTAWDDTTDKMTADALTPLDFVLDVCLMQHPRLVTASEMMQYRLPLTRPFFVEGLWAPVFASLLTEPLVLGLVDMHGSLLAKLSAFIRNLHTLILTFEEGSNCCVRGELAVYEQVATGLMTRTVPPSPHATCEDVVHLLAGCADLASHVRLYGSLGQSVLYKATLLGEMLGVACSEHAGLVARHTAAQAFLVPYSPSVVYKTDSGPANRDAQICPPCFPAPVPGCVFGPSIGWGASGTPGRDSADFTRNATPSPQRDALGWSANAWSDRLAPPGSPSHGPIGPPPKSPVRRAAAKQEPRGDARPRRRRAREGDDAEHPRPPPSSR